MVVVRVRGGYIEHATDKIRNKEQRKADVVRRAGHLITLNSNKRYLPSDPQAHRDAQILDRAIRVLLKSPKSFLRFVRKDGDALRDTVSISNASLLSIDVAFGVEYSPLNQSINAHLSIESSYRLDSKSGYISVRREPFEAILRLISTRSGVYVNIRYVRIYDDVERIKHYVFKQLKAGNISETTEDVAV